MLLLLLLWLVLLLVDISSIIIIITIIVILSMFMIIMIIMIMFIKYFILIIIIMIYPMLLNFLGISAIIPARAGLCSCHWQSPRICGIFSLRSVNLWLSPEVGYLVNFRFGSCKCQAVECSILPRSCEAQTIFCRSPARTKGTWHRHQRTLKV